MGEGRRRFREGEENFKQREIKKGKEGKGDGGVGCV
jgi:hypothetical protein